jgi:hypothetical protein
MPLTIDELDAELTRLRVELEALKQQANRRRTLRDFGKRFTGDEQLAAIHEEIERQRRIPDPDLQGS